MSFSEFFKKIFSIENIEQEKVFTILGYKIKLNRRLFYYKLYSSLPIKKNRIVMNNFGGNGYGCNPKYIAEEILKRNLPYEIVWLCLDKEEARKQGLPKKIKTYQYGKKAIKLLYSSKMIISNVHCNPLINKGWQKTEKQKYIQTWHGSLGIKKLDFSVKNDKNVFLNKSKKKLNKFDMDMTDYLISNSAFEENVFREGLLWDREFTKVGHPRNDIFFKTEQELHEIRQKVCNNLNLDINKKFVLYAPSFRDDKDISVFNLDFDKVTGVLSEKFGGDWVVLVKYHPNLIKILKDFEFNENEKVINVTSYPDIQELLVSVDIGITDYSSWIFDYMLSKKAGFIYAEDIEKYNTERGFYYPLETTPFPVARNNEELMNNILNFDNEKYQKDVDTFLQEKGCIEDGHASERIVDLIGTIIK